MSKLYFKYGTMGSGKSMQLISIAKNYELQGKKIVILSPFIDSRTEEIESRNGMSLSCYKFKNDEDLFYIISELLKEIDINCVLVDEAQFLNKEQVMQLVKIVDVFNIPTITFGLKTDFKGNLFEGSQSLIEMADKIEEIKTVCWFCNKKALFNMRVDENNKKILDGDQVVLGFNNYIPVCRKCYFKN